MLRGQNGSKNQAFLPDTTDRDTVVLSGVCIGAVTFVLVAVLGVQLEMKRDWASLNKQLRRIYRTPTLTSNFGKVDRFSMPAFLRSRMSTRTETTQFAWRHMASLARDCDVTSWPVLVNCWISPPFANVVMNCSASPEFASAVVECRIERLFSKCSAAVTGGVCVDCRCGLHTSAHQASRMRTMNRRVGNGKRSDIGWGERVLLKRCAV